ncbi:hypothetical protein Ancab_009167 [Ancistrocladus abbreviatus]
MGYANNSVADTTWGQEGEISGECLYFPGEDYKPDWGIIIDSSHGSLSSPTVGGETGDLPGHGIGNPQMLSGNPVIGNTIGDERAGGPNTVEWRSMAGPIASKTQAGNPAFPENSLRELTRGYAWLDLGPACRTNGEAIGPTHSLGQSVFRRAEGVAACLGRGVHIKSRPKYVDVSSSGPGCSGSSDKPKTTSVEVHSPSGPSKIPREANGNANTVCNSHSNSKLRKMGCRNSTMKLGVGLRQRTCRAKKKIQKQKARSTINRAANSTGASKNKSEGITGVSISNSNIANMNGLFLLNEWKMTAEEIWDVGKKLGAVYEGEESELLIRLDNMETRDFEAWNEMEGKGTVGDGVEPLT